MRQLAVGIAALCSACFSPDKPRATDATHGETSNTPTSDPTATEPTSADTTTDPSATTDPTDPTDPTNSGPTDATISDTATDATTDATTTNAESSSTGAPDPVCGNSVPEGDEACDDGNDIDTDACTNVCALPACGDLIVSGAEECDDGNAVDDDFCNNACLSTLRPNVLLCGTSTRDVTAFFPDGALLQLVMSCTPDADTQAMLITRDGTVDAPTLQAYVSGGGILLTEVFISDDVFNAVFGAAVVEGAFFGNCLDVAPTIEQFNNFDPFWSDNAFVGITLEESGCGSNLIDYPGIVPLAGWDAASVSIAYRDDGPGRVWLDEFDWTDGEGAVYDYTEQLMGYMITHAD